MRKQEAINKLESLKMIGTDQRANCYNEAIKAGVLVIKQIDETTNLVEMENISGHEVIDRIRKAIIDELSGNYYREVDNYGYTEYERYSEEDAQSVANDIILDFEEEIKQLYESKETEAVVFKHDEKFVVEWLDQTISYRFSLYNAMNNGCSDIIEWMKRDDNSNRFAQAFISLKYKLEKQPLWVIKNADGNYLTNCSLWGKDGVNYSFECNPSDKLLFTDKSIADATALLVNGTAEQEEVEQ